MGLIKKTQRKGFECEYFRVVQVNCNADRGDAVATFALYKDKATRDEDATAVIDSYQTDLGADFNDKVLSSEIDTKDVVKKSAYEALMVKATAEDLKEEDKDETLAFFKDATDELTVVEK